MVRIGTLLFFATTLFFVEARWGKTGHRVIGEIAQAHLSRKSQKVIKAILGDESLACASNWADFIRSDPQKYAYTFPWHYINLADNQNYKDNPSSKGDIIQALELCKAKLKNRHVLSLDSQRFYLRLLIHFVGDIHQPLHVGYAADKGGNTIKVKWFGKVSNLHKVWDEDIIDYTQLSYTEYAQILDSFKNKPKPEKIDLATWLQEGLELRKMVYASTSQHNELGYRYVYDHIKLLENRLLIAGLRLSHLLNVLFK